jgi:hypothetical protein
LCHFARICAIFNEFHAIFNGFCTILHHFAPFSHHFAPFSHHFAPFSHHFAPFFLPLPPPPSYGIDGAITAILSVHAPFLIAYWLGGATRQWLWLGGSSLIGLITLVVGWTFIFFRVIIRGLWLKMD